jgi:protein-tyrosine phosphatase
MKYGVMLAVLGLAQIVFARDAGVFVWLLGWSGLSWVFAGCAYVFLGAGAFGKQTNGNMDWRRVLFLFPYLAATWLLWYAQKTLTKEPIYSQIAPGIWLGRRCFAHELPPEVELVVDLTAEFAEPRQMREGRAYICVPTLDASVPSLEAFQKLIQRIIDFEGQTYIHCALGHGRSATVVIAVLVARGNALSLDQAEQRVKLARPGIGVNTAQRHLLQHWIAQSLPR